MCFLKDDNIEKVRRQLQRCVNIYNNTFSFNRLDIKDRKIIESNAEFKEKYKGKICFIIGNGPSVNKVDFKKLKKELVITVNSMILHDRFCDLNSDFHFLADPVYFKLNKKIEGDKEIIQKMNLLSHTNTKLFMPIQGIRSTKVYGWYKCIDIRYFVSKLYFYDNYKEDIDFAKYIPAFQGVIHWGIAFALYMGCKEIYLLGCDATNMIASFSLLKDKEAGLEYAYDLSNDAAILAKKRNCDLGLEYLLYGYWRIVHIFSELFYYCKRNGVKLINCSEESILESIPKQKLENIL